MPSLTQKERAARRRQELLDNVQQQIRNGTLVVRQMTPEERARWTRSARNRRTAKPR